MVANAFNSDEARVILIRWQQNHPVSVLSSKSYYLPGKHKPLRRPCLRVRAMLSWSNVAQAALRMYDFSNPPRNSWHRISLVCTELVSTSCALSHIWWPGCSGMQFPISSICHVISTFLICNNYLEAKSKTIRLSSGMIRKPEPGSFVNAPRIADME